MEKNEKDFYLTEEQTEAILKELQIYQEANAVSFVDAEFKIKVFVFEIVKKDNKED